jgi:hypothetical protein
MHKCTLRFVVVWVEQIVSNVDKLTKHLAVMEEMIRNKKEEE